MSGKQVECRSCGTEYPFEAANCPECGTEIRGWKGPVAALVLGGLIAGFSLFDITTNWLFFLFGVLLVVAGGLLLRERRSAIVNPN